jgi:hypothetical protein
MTWLKLKTIQTECGMYNSEIFFDDNDRKKNTQWFNNEALSTEKKA